ncbi:MAG: glycoside hydrolase family 2 TIM barrel-domain containing protein [Ginsengibacter sp.]
MQVIGDEIFLNGKSIFLKGINIHEEIPQEARRAYSKADAEMLMHWAKELGCNFVRLTHYPHNEHMVRLADKLGIMLWEEVPLWQNIQFSNPKIMNKADTMLNEMITRDKNRCSIIMWSLSNETSPSPDRNKTITAMAGYVRSLDSTRLITTALNHVRYDDNVITIDDSICNVLDVVGVNEYLGWYVTWPAKPGDMVWKNPYNKPLIMSEFGAESLYGQHGSADSNGHWTEEREAQVYKDQLTMFKNIPFLRGTVPWVMADFRSESRLQPVFQQGWNRKGLLSSKGLKKKAWYVMHDFYEEMQ